MQPFGGKGDCFLNLSKSLKKNWQMTVFFLIFFLLQAAMDHPNCDKIYLTEIQKTFECDTFFPEFDRNKFQLINEDGVNSEKQTENGIDYYTRVYKKC